MCDESLPFIHHVTVSPFCVYSRLDDVYMLCFNCVVIKIDEGALLKNFILAQYFENSFRYTILYSAQMC